MKVSLADRERYSMLFLGGPLNFTYDEPGPIEIDFNALTPEQRTQLYYNWKRGVLMVDDENALKSACETVVTVPQNIGVATGSEPVTQPQDIDDAIKARSLKLKAILREKIGSIKRKLHDLSTSELTDLLEIEKEQKKRKALIDIIQGSIDKKCKVVGKAVGDQDVGNNTFNPYAQPLDNSLDVVDSEMEDVTLIPSDKELAKDDG